MNAHSHRTLNFLYNLDVPDAPEGPVEISNITKDSVTLSWQPPSKDGGSPLIGYVIEQRDTRRSQWVKSGSVDKDTTTFTASKLMEDSEYVFRVSAVNAEGDSTPLESSPAKPTRPKSKSCTIFYLVVILFITGTLECLKLYAKPLMNKD